MKRPLRRGVVALGLLAAPVLATAGGHGYYYFTVIPGQKPTLDEVCVTTSVEVGAHSRNANGDDIAIKDIVGKSPMCKDKTKPLLAHVAYTASESFQSTLRIGLPEGFKEMPITDKERFEGLRFHAWNAKRSMAVFIHTWDRRAVPRFDNFVRDNKLRQIDGNDWTQSRMEEIEVDGLSARRWTTQASKPAGLFAKARSYVETYVLGEKEIAAVQIGVNGDDLANEAVEINDIIAGLKGLSATPV